MGIILASQSPRRRELLAQMGMTGFTVSPAKGEEDMGAGLPPDQLVESLALAKAREVAAGAAADDIIIAADTIVTLDGQVLGKPHSEHEAFEMLRTLSGRDHVVYTGLAVLRGGETISGHEATQVRFRPLSDEEIRAYIATGEPMDKAGAYGIQGRGALLVEGIRGDYFNVVGLPVCKLGRILDRLGVKLLAY